MKTATQTSLSIGGFAGPAQHYALSEPLCGNDHVVVWTQDAFGQQAAEAVIIAARPDGSAINMTRLPGSFVHPEPTPDAALELAGYQVVRQ